VAKTNYQQLRKQKEAARKNRRQEKLDRRGQKEPEDTVASPTDIPVSQPTPPDGGAVE
jgi:hypothetical protein